MGGINALEARRQILFNTPHIETASGSIATFKTDMVGKLKECKIYFEPVQEGSGDPSPDNVRPIDGWTGCGISVNGTTIPIDWTDEAGTVYGGYVDLIKGEVVAECRTVRLDNSIGLRYANAFYDGKIATNRFFYVSGFVGNSLYKQRLATSDKFQWKSGGIWGRPDSSVWNWTMNANSQVHFTVQNDAVGITSDMGPSERTTHIRNWLSTNPILFVLKLATPIHYPIDPITLKTLRGTNNIFANTNGNTEVKFYTH